VQVVRHTTQDLINLELSNIKYYAVQFGYEYPSGSGTFTSSLTTVSSSINCTPFKAYDGYNLFPSDNQVLFGGSGTGYGYENLPNFPLSASCNNWPWMTDLTTVTQSVLINQINAVRGNNLGLTYWNGQSDSITKAPTTIAFTASYENGTILSSSFTASSGFRDSTNTNSQFNRVADTPGFGTAGGFLPPTSSAGSPLFKYQIQAYSGSVAINNPVHYKVVCEQYYTPVLVAYKNRFGCFDYINFFKRSNEAFQTDTKTYQPQIGRWEDPILTYQESQTKYQRYVVDAYETLQVNSDWLEEGYNQLIKQLMVSEEIYWVEQVFSFSPGTFYSSVRPLSIQTRDITFKTHINNKLIQYNFVFNLGRSFKLQF